MLMSRTPPTHGRYVQLSMDLSTLLTLTLTLTLTRYVQLSMDLSTLRWSWNDYILIHEMACEPSVDATGEGGAEQRSLTLDYMSPGGSRMRLRLSFASSETFDIWHRGMAALYEPTCCRRGSDPPAPCPPWAPPLPLMSSRLSR